MNFENSLKRTAAEVDRLLDRILPLDSSRAPRVIEAITRQHGIEVDESTGDMNRFKRRVQNRLDAGHGKGEVRLPEMTTFRRLTEAILPGKAEAVAGILGVPNAVRAFRSYGSTAPDEVNEQLTEWQGRLA